ncbi:MAG: hypothetical protein ACQER9_01390 [Nanobdellota archaeon]
MKQKLVFILMLMFALLVFPTAIADTIFPTVTNVYFEKNGQAYNENIEFTVKGYGYSYPIGPPVEKEQGTYTPEVVYSFSANYNNYGDKIYENYYRNYVHIDYYKLEGKTSDGKNFIITNISEIPTKCNWLDEINDSRTNEKGRPIEKVCELRFNLDNAEWKKEDIPDPTPETRGFWSKIGCFFKTLFNGSCE